jgi:erythromycin esterase
MIPVSLSRRYVSRRFVAGALVATACAAASAQQTVEPLEHWAAMHAMLIRTVEPDSNVADLRQLVPLIGTARVVALGEPAHGAHEPLAFRNRLFEYLVEERGFTAIAIESGLPESGRIQDFVEGGPGDAGLIVRDNLSYGFGALQENAELVQWMRAYNADPTHRRHVRFYGVDLSIGGPRGYTPTPVALKAVLAYLIRVDRTSAQRAQTTLQPFLAQLPGAASLSPAEHDRLSGAIDDVMSVLARKRRTFIAATSDAEYDWAQRNAVVARQSELEFRVALPGAPPAAILPGDCRAAEERNRAMADNVRWVLAQEGPAGRVLVFAHNAHIMNARLEGGIWNAFERAPNAMGLYLRSTLGKHLVIVGVSSAASFRGFPAWVPDASNVDAALARVGLPRFLLDLRASRADRPVAAWLAERRTLRANFTTALTLTPGKAFDALVFIETLTPAHTTLPPQ